MTTSGRRGFDSIRRMRSSCCTTSSARSVTGDSNSTPLPRSTSTRLIQTSYLARLLPSTQTPLSLYLSLHLGFITLASERPHPTLMRATSSFSVDDDVWPPGFRFHPTDEELVLYYLKRKICHRRLKLDAIAEVDVYKADPDELPGLSKLKTGDRQWFFFSPRDRKYPNGGRSNRATRHGYWKVTGKDRSITCNSRSIGIKKTLIFYKGRAPSGERTDWVMHEYTLDEAELQGCPAQDHYALYKVFKKSGPGPKNGEQYGAPFREEDWADDEQTVDIVDFSPLQVISGHDSLDNTVINCDTEVRINSRDEFLNEVNNDSMFEPISQIQETSGIPFANNMNRQGSHNSEENFVSGYLELDDLFGPKSTNQNVEKPVDDLRIEDYDGLFDLDFFQDVSAILPDVDINFGIQISNAVIQSCPNNLENGVVVDQVLSPYFNDFHAEVAQPISLPYYNLGNEMVNQFDFQMPHNPDMTSQQWIPHQNPYMSTPAVPNQGSFTPPPSGVLYAGDNQFQNQNQNENLNDNEGGGSRFSSTVWSLLESIPTTPASAAESTALVNKAFERLSSFGKIDNAKISKIYVSSNAGKPDTTRRRSRSKYNRGFMFFSVFGVLCGILWVSLAYL